MQFHVPSLLRPITNSPSFRDKGLIVSGVEVQRGVCIGHRTGLPTSVILSEIFEWDQTVIRSKLAQKHTGTHIVVHIHVHGHSHLPGCKWAAAGGGGGVGDGLREMELLL